MKKNITYIFAILFSMGLGACSNFLEENPVDQMPEDEAYKNPEMIYLNSVSNLYTKVGGNGWSQGLQGSDRGIYDLNTFSSDEAMLPTRGGDWNDGGMWRDLFQHKWNTDYQPVKGTWDYLYNVIVLCNRSIDKLTALKELDPSNENFDIYKSEVRAFRAMYYFYLLDLYARVPIVESSTTKMSEISQSERSEVFDFVKKELEETVGQLSTKSSANKGSHYGRMTQPVAYFLLAKLAINAEIYADDNWMDEAHPSANDIMFEVEGEQKNAWEACIAYCDKIESLGFKLEPGLSGFASNFAVENEGSMENIFTIPMDAKAYSNNFINLCRSRHYTVGNAFSQGGWNGACATLECMKTFGYGTETSDPRLEVSYYTGKIMGPDGEYIKNEDKEDFEYEPLNVELNFDIENNPTYKYGGARMKKYEEDFTAGEGGMRPHNDIVLFRFADVVLMKAEALVRSGKSGQTEFNRIRERVGAPLRECNLENILAERMLELSWEGWRRNDLIRFGEYCKHITDRDVTDNHVIVFPISKDVLDVNTNLTQNAGY